MRELTQHDIDLLNVMESQCQFSFHLPPFLNSNNMFCEIDDSEINTISDRLFLMGFISRFVEIEDKKYIEVLGAID